MQLIRDKSLLRAHRRLNMKTHFLWLHREQGGLEAPDQENAMVLGLISVLRSAPNAFLVVLMNRETWLQVPHHDFLF